MQPSQDPSGRLLLSGKEAVALAALPVAVRGRQRQHFDFPAQIWRVNLGLDFAGKPHPATTTRSSTWG
jgi:hypothetical protein